MNEYTPSGELGGVVGDELSPLDVVSTEGTPETVASDDSKDSTSESRIEPIPEPVAFTEIEKGAIRDNLSEVFTKLKVPAPPKEKISIPDFKDLITKPLLGVKVTVVDDEAAAMLRLLRSVSIATGGHVDACHHTRRDAIEGTDAFVQKILETNPDLVIMDFDLAEGAKGDEVARGLLSAKPELKILGMSGNLDAVVAFGELGVPNTVQKNPNEDQELDNMEAIVRGYTTEAGTDLGISRENEKRVIVDIKNKADEELRKEDEATVRRLHDEMFNQD